LGHPSAIRGPRSRGFQVKALFATEMKKMGGGVSDGFANLGPSFAAETAALSG
jgi:hypothetical protein